MILYIVMIKVLILESQLHHIPKHLVQSSNNTKQWYDTRLLQLIQERWQLLKLTVLKIYCIYHEQHRLPGVMHRKPVYLSFRSQYFSEVSTWLTSHRYPNLMRDHFTGRGANQVAGGQHAGGWNWIFVKVGAMPTSFLEWENVSNSFESDKFQRITKINMTWCHVVHSMDLYTSHFQKILKERQAPRTPAPGVFTYIAGLYAMRSGSGSL